MVIYRANHDWTYQNTQRILRSLFRATPVRGVFDTFSIADRSEPRKAHIAIASSTPGSVSTRILRSELARRDQIRRKGL